MKRIFATIPRALICPTRQCTSSCTVANDQRKLTDLGRHSRRSLGWQGGRRCICAAAVLTILSGLFYAAGNHELGFIGSDVCRYGGSFCQNPHYVLVGAIVAGLWGAFVSVR